MFIIVFIDDILVYSPSKKAVKEHLKEALHILGKKKLYVKFGKYEFWLKIVIFLEHVISKQGISVDPKMVETIMIWLSHKCTIKVRGS